MSMPQKAYYAESNILLVNFKCYKKNCYKTISKGFYLILWSDKLHKILNILKSIIKYK